MLELNLPKFDFRLEKSQDYIYIWDILRRKNLVLTPEEWTRQHFVNYLINHLNYPISRLANEIEIKVNNQKKRCDTIVYNQYLEPIMILEYKAPSIKINSKVIDQILRYNITLQVKYLVISNGMQHYCYKLSDKKTEFNPIELVPKYSEIITILEE